VARPRSLASGTAWTRESGCLMAVVQDAIESVSPMLEVIDKGSCSESHPVPLLFVHGAWHAAWCWDEHFLDFFADKGYRALAVSLRGHGSSPTPKPLRSCSIADYVVDVASVADSLPVRPVVIGHSMGGGIVQKYLESHESPAGVLLASVPPRGIRGATLRFARRHPWLLVKSALTGDTMATVSTPACAREYMFSSRTPESLIIDGVRRFQQESRRAIYVDMMFRNLPRPERVTAPVLVMGAEDDGSFSTEEVRATAHEYHTEPEIFSGMGHDMMLEPGWADVAERIHNWLNARGL
jgi:pimeloyl-ACP methyl ester carboxylesterase